MAIGVAGVLAGASLLSSGASILSSRSSAKKSEKLQKRAVAVQEGSLQLAKDQFKLFQPVLQQFSNFFSEVPIDDIVSGRVLAPGAARAISEINLLSNRRRDSLNSELARRGISNDTAGQLLRLENERFRDQDILRAKDQSIQAALNRRLQFAGQGQQAFATQQNAASNLTSTLSNASAQQAGQAQAASRAAGSAALGAGLLLALQREQGPATSGIADAPPDIPGVIPDLMDDADRRRRLGNRSLFFD